MTEEEWLAGEASFEEALHDLGTDLSERKRRLFLCACVRQAWPLLEEPSRWAVEVAEQYADGLATARERDRAWARCIELRFLGVGNPADRAALVAAGHIVGTAFGCSLVVQALVLEAERQFACGLLPPGSADGLAERLRASQEALFRDIVGNPFRAPRIDPDWLRFGDGLLPRLAGLIYQDRRWADMPVLGDALEDAGCSDDDLLEHCHGPGPHTRGCWLLDLLLGRS